MSLSPSSSVLKGIFRVADPKITLASMSSIWLGFSASARDGTISLTWLAWTIIGIFLLEAAKNASGEIFDWDSGTDSGVTEADRSPFSGGKRVLVDGLMTRGQTIIMAALLYAGGIACGIGIVLWREPGIVWIGVLGVALAFFYHAPPIKLSYRGLGELTVALVYGPLIASGTYLVQRHHLTAETVLLSMPLALLIGAFLWINEFPDCRADRDAGKRTLVVILGRRWSARGFTGIVVAAFVLLALLPLAGLPALTALGFIGLPPSVLAAHRLLTHPDTTKAIVPAQAWTLLGFVLMSAGTGAGLLLAH